MKILSWLLLLPVDLVSNLVSFPAALIVALFSDATARRWFSWFVTPDNPVTGDTGHEARWAGRHVYLKKVAWLWRNCAYGFSSTVLRAKTRGPVTVKGNPAVSNRPFMPGLVIRTTPEGYWQFYLVKPTIKNKVLRVNLGWKLWGNPENPFFGQYVLAINPLMGAS